MENYHLAVDIGASSGRHILGHMEAGKMILEEIHRFSNGMERKDGELCWDLDRLFDEILQGMKKCRELGKVPVSVGIDTWAVDFVLLAANGRPSHPAISGIWPETLKSDFRRNSWERKSRSDKSNDCGNV